jgi:hypothetical protein
MAADKSVCLDKPVAASSNSSDGGERKALTNSDCDGSSAIGKLALTARDNAPRLQLDHGNPARIGEVDIGVPSPWNDLESFRMRRQSDVGDLPM